MTRSYSRAQNRSIKPELSGLLTKNRPEVHTGVDLRLSEMPSEVGDLGIKQEMTLSSLEVFDRGLEEAAVSTSCYVDGRNCRRSEKML